MIFTAGVHSSDGGSWPASLVGPRRVLSGGSHRVLFDGSYRSNADSDDTFDNSV
jgi:hypothetical protein